MAKYGHFDHLTDMWSLGMLMYGLYVKQALFQAPKTQDILNKIIYNAVPVPENVRILF